MEKMMPHNLEAERALLGSILIDSDALIQVADILCANDFYRSAHTDIYLAMLRLSERHMPADFVTLADELEKKHQLEDIGGVSYLLSLVNECLTSSHAEYYAHLIAKKAEARRLLHAASVIAALAYEEVDDAVQQAEQLVFDVQKHGKQSGFQSLAQMAYPYMQELNLLHDHHQKVIGVPTGYHAIDDMLGGMQPTDLLILAGRPAMGKSAIALNIASNAASKHNKAVALFSLEMGGRQLFRRLMSMESGVDMQRLRNGWVADGEWDAITLASGKLADLPIWINDTSGNPIASMRSQLRRLIAEQDIDLVIVDYLQLIEMETGVSAKRYENRVQEINTISRQLKQLAKDFDVPVLALAQLSRAVESRGSKIPQLSDLKESGGIEENADVVMLIYRDDYYALQEQRASNAPNMTDIIVAKHRNGPVGTVQLYFQADQTKFYDVAKEGKHGL